jgi:uncharacterized protein
MIKSTPGAAGNRLTTLIYLGYPLLKLEAMAHHRVRITAIGNARECGRRRKGRCVVGVLCRMPDPRDVSVYQMLHNIVRALVDHPQQAVIKTDWTRDGAVFTIQVHPDDAGKIIGKQGRNAKAIRTIIAGVATKLRRRYVIDIDDQPSELVEGE